MPRKQKVAFLHGWGLNRKIWTHVTRRLTHEYPHFECQLLDLPGYGGMADIQNASNLESLAQHCLNQLSEPAVLVGWSLGGMVAMQAALFDQAESESRITGLQLITTSPKFVASSDWPSGVDLSTFQRFSDELASDYERTLTMFLLLQAGASAGSRELARSAHAAICDLPPPSAKTLQDGIDCLANSDLRPRLHELTLPVQVVSGLRDRVAKPESSAQLAGLLGAELIEFNAGHSPFMTKPDEYVQTLSDFVQKIDRQGD